MGRLNLKPFKITQNFKIKMFDRDCVVNDLVLTREAIFIKGKELLVDLIVFDILNFDLILGMDFLETYRDEIDCKRKKVKFTHDDGEEFNFS